MLALLIKYIHQTHTRYDLHKLLLIDPLNPGPVHVMMTSSNGNIFRVTDHLCGEFTGPRWIPAQRPLTRSFDVFFDLRLNKRFSEQSRGWWFETLLCPLWRHSNVQNTNLVITLHANAPTLNGARPQPVTIVNTKLGIWVVSRFLCHYWFLKTRSPIRRYHSKWPTRPRELSNLINAQNKSISSSRDLSTFPGLLPSAHNEHPCKIWGVFCKGEVWPTINL